MERLLPRQLQLIYEINADILGELRKRPDNGDPFLSDVSLIDESYGRFVRMGHLAFLGARKVNGVSALHGELMKQTVFQQAAPAVPRPDHGDHQRRHPAPLGPGFEPRARRPDHRDAWATVAGSPISSVSRSLPRARPTPPSRPASPRSSRPTRSGWPSFIVRAARRRAADRRAVRRAHQAHPRVQAPAAQHPGGGRDLRRHPRRHARQLGPAGQDLRRQGGALLHARQADHQVHQRRRQRGERRAQGRRSAEDPVPAELQRVPGRRS